MYLADRALLTYRSRVLAERSRRRTYSRFGRLIHEPQLLRSTSAAQRRSSHLANHLVAFWNTAKASHGEARGLFRSEGATLEEVEAYRQSEAREIELGVATWQDHFSELVFPSFELPSSALTACSCSSSASRARRCARPTPVRGASLSAAQRTASRNLGAPFPSFPTFFAPY